MDALDARQRSRICWRVAGSAVVLALGKVPVLRIAVAAPGARQPYGVNPPLGWPFAWGLVDTDDEEDSAAGGQPRAELAHVMPDTASSGPRADWLCDHDGFAQDLRGLSPADAIERLRAMRARVCGMMGGYLAEHRVLGQVINLHEPCWGMHWDVQRGLAIASLIGPKAAERLAGVTAAALAEPEVWRVVSELARALEVGAYRHGPLPWLPAPRVGWPDLS